MGRGRNRLIDQSQKKPKIRKDKESGEAQGWHFDGPNYNKNENLVFLPAHLVEAMKQMDPQEVANIHFSKEM